MNNLHFKRLNSNVLPIAIGDDVYLAYTPDGELFVVDSSGASKIVIDETLNNVSQRVLDVVEALESKLTNQDQALAALIAKTERLATAYNNAIKVINDLSERLTALESNYDPTVIK